MTRAPVKDHATSIRARLLNYSREHGEDYQRILTRYAIERLLFRLSRTEVGQDYILKGAMLFLTWPEHVFRATGDLDLLGRGNSDPAAITELFTRICRIESRDDGIIFDAATLMVETARQGQRYEGARLSLKGELAKAIIPVQVDIGFGDHVHPAPSRRTFPGLLPELPAAHILMYPPETVVAEKFEAMIRFGEANGRIKDFYDIWVTTRTFQFELSVLVRAIGETLRRRQSPIPTVMPVAFTPRFAESVAKGGLWTGFLRRSRPTLTPPPFEALQVELSRFFELILVALAAPGRTSGRWDPDLNAWTERAESAGPVTASR